MKKSFFILLFFCLAVEARPPAAEISFPRHQEYDIKEAPLSLDAIKTALELEGIINQDYVLAQIKLETGHLTSELCLINNNLIGMKFPKVRKTTAIGKVDHNYATYKSWYDCVRDIRLWQQYYLSKGRDLSNYPAFLASVGYASDPKYLQKIAEIMKK